MVATPKMVSLSCGFLLFNEGKISVTLLEPSLFADSIRYPGGIRAPNAVKRSTRNIFSLWMEKTSTWHLCVPRDLFSF